jgi:histidinol dehydrogenase
MFRNKKVVIVLPAYNAAMTLEKTVAEILLDVKENGDLAVKKYNEKFQKFITFIMHYLYGAKCLWAET